MQRRSDPRKKPAKSKDALEERKRIVRYIRREAKKLSIVMPIPDAIIRDTMLAVAMEIEGGYHE